MNAGDWDRRYAATDLVWGQGPNQFLVSELADLRPATGLDVACGEGRNALWLAERGCQTIGVDYSAVAIDKARAIAAKRELQVSFEVADVCTWRCPVSVELAIIFYLQLPWDKMQAAIANTAAAVEPGGTILIVGHDLENLTRGTGGPQDPEVLYTPEMLSGCLDGFEIVRAETVERPVEAKTNPAIDNLVRALKV